MDREFLCVAVLLVVSLFAVVVVWMRWPKERKYILVKRLQELITDEAYTSMTYLEICSALEVTDRNERRFIFEELMRLINEETLIATEERRGPKLYYSKVAQ